jgi:hypothetical protein
VPVTRRRITLTLSATAGFLVLVLVAVVIFAAWSIRRPFPDYDGDVELPRLSAEVEVIRDEHGIAHIYADTAEDLFRAQGYVHAQDRFWEMDFRRHVTSGRISELFGEDHIETDAFVRTLGWRQVALLPVWLGLAAMAQWQPPQWGVTGGLIAVLAILLGYVVVLRLRPFLKLVGVLRGNRIAIASVYVGVRSEYEETTS